jgi:CRP-like cAMP-binding protein
LSNAPSPARCKNLLLTALPDDEYQRLSGDLERVDAALGDSIIREYERAEWAYFPEEAVCSIIRILEDGAMIEVGVIGFDGVVGFQSLAEGVEQPYRVIVQHAGTLLRMPMHRFREEFRRGGEFQELLLRFSAKFLLQVSQTAACNRLHTIDRRLARWLLMMRDRTVSNGLELTQEFLSHMLGARIAGVNEAVRALSQSGLIKHTRGSIEILDREALEQATCECYRFVKNRTAFAS